MGSNPIIFGSAAVFTCAAYRLLQGHATCKQRKTAIATMALALAFFMLAQSNHLVGDTPSTSHSRTPPPVFSIPTECERMQDFLSGNLVLGGDSAALLTTFNNTVGLDCPNRLLWKCCFLTEGTGNIFGIRPSDMNASAMWGLDLWNRPFVALRYSCGNAAKGVVSLFQEFIASGQTIVVSHGDSSMLNCSRLLFDRGEWDLFDNLRQLLSKKVLSLPTDEGFLTLKLV